MRDNRVMLRLVLLALLLYALGSYAGAHGELERLQANTRVLEGKKQELLEQREELEERLQALEDPTLLRRLAWERLRMVSPGERVFYFTDSAVSSG